MSEVRFLEALQDAIEALMELEKRGRPVPFGVTANANHVWMLRLALENVLDSAIPPAALVPAVN